MNYALGCWQFGPSFGFFKTPDGVVSKRTIRTALDFGITRFDTARSYANGESEKILGSALRQAGIDRDKVIIDTKLMPCAPELLRKKVTESLKRLNTGYIDTLYIHYPQSGFDTDALLSGMAKLKEEGIIKRIGVSNFCAKQVLSLKKKNEVSAFQRIVSPVFVKNLDSDRLFCKENNIELLGYSPLALGLLSGKYKRKEDLADARRDLFVFNPAAFGVFSELLDEILNIGEPKAVCYAWVKKAGADTMVFGASDPEQLKENVKLFDYEITDAEFERINGKAKLLCRTLPPDASNVFLHESR